MLTLLSMSKQTNEYLEVFTDRLNQTASRRGLKQKDIIERTGLPKSAVSSYFAGKYMPRQDGVYLLAKALDVDPGWLAGLNSKATPSYNKDTCLLTIPFLSQKLSAGPGQEYMPDDCIEVKEIDVLAPMLHGVTDRSKLVASEVRGDSMTGAHILSGDIVVFQRGLVVGEGIYVITLGGDVLVKRIAFNRATSKVTIISANPDYPPQTVDSDIVTILGKVVGWIHGEPA